MSKLFELIHKNLLAQGKKCDPNISQIIQTILEQNPKEKQPSEIDLLIDVLPIFKFFDRYVSEKDILRALVINMSLEAYQQDEKIYQIGDKSDKVYFILDGEVAIYIDQDEQDYKKIIEDRQRKQARKAQQNKDIKVSIDVEEDEDQAIIGEFGELIWNYKEPEVKSIAALKQAKTMEEGDNFGEVSMMMINQLRTATVVAKSAKTKEKSEQKLCIVAVIRRENYQSIYVDYETKILNKATQALAQIPAFSQWPVPFLQILYRKFGSQRFQKGEQVFSEQEDPQSVFVIKEGEFSIQTFGNLELFGQEDIIKKQKRSYAVICDSLQGGELMVLRKVDFEQFVLTQSIADETILPRAIAKIQHLQERIEQIVNNVDTFRHFLAENREELKQNLVEEENHKLLISQRFNINPNSPHKLAGVNREDSNQKIKKDLNKSFQRINARDVESPPKNLHQDYLEITDQNQNNLTNNNNLQDSALFFQHPANVQANMSKTLQLPNQNSSGNKKFNLNLQNDISKGGNLNINNNYNSNSNNNNFNNPTSKLNDLKDQNNYRYKSVDQRIIYPPQIQQFSTPASEKKSNLSFTIGNNLVASPQPQTNLTKKLHVVVPPSINQNQAEFPPKKGSMQLNQRLNANQTGFFSARTGNQPPIVGHPPNNIFIENQSFHKGEQSSAEVPNVNFELNSTEIKLATKEKGIAGAIAAQSSQYNNANNCNSIIINNNNNNKRESPRLQNPSNKGDLPIQPQLRRGLAGYNLPIDLKQMQNISTNNQMNNLAYRREMNQKRDRISQADCQADSRDGFERQLDWISDKNVDKMKQIQDLDKIHKSLVKEEVKFSDLNDFLEPEYKIPEEKFNYIFTWREGPTPVDRPFKILKDHGFFNNIARPKKRSYFIPVNSNRFPSTSSTPGTSLPHSMPRQLVRAENQANSMLTGPRSVLLQNNSQTQTQNHTPLQNPHLNHPPGGDRSAFSDDANQSELFSPHEILQQNNTFFLTSHKQQIFGNPGIGSVSPIGEQPNSFNFVNSNVSSSPQPYINDTPYQHFTFVDSELLSRHWDNNVMMLDNIAGNPTPFAEMFPASPPLAAKLPAVSLQQTSPRLQLAKGAFRRLLKRKINKISDNLEDNLKEMRNMIFQNFDLNQIQQQELISHFGMPVKKK